MWGRVLHCWDLPSIWVEDLEASEQWFSECSPQILFNRSVVSDSVTLWAVGLCVCVWSLSSIRLCNPMDCSLPGSSVHEIFQQEYCSGLQFPLPRDLPDPGIKPTSPASASGFFITVNVFVWEVVRKANSCIICLHVSGLSH